MFECILCTLFYVLPFDVINNDDDDDNLYQNRLITVNFSLHIRECMRVKRTMRYDFP